MDFAKICVGIVQHLTDTTYKNIKLAIEQMVSLSQKPKEDTIQGSKPSATATLRPPTIVYVYICTEVILFSFCISKFYDLIIFSSRHYITFWYFSFCIDGFLFHFNCPGPLWSHLRGMLSSQKLCRRSN